MQFESPGHFRHNSPRRLKTNGRACQPVSSRAVTPPKAQHPQPLRHKDYWHRQIWRALNYPTTEGAGNAICNLSGTEDRGGAADFCCAFFHFWKANMTLKQTPLNAAHRAMGAKMVDFGGWDMPVNYGSQIDEHHQVRNDCGMFDVCHMRVVDTEGDGVRAFLRYLLANNADKLALPGKALYSAMLRPDGGVIDDLIIYFMSEQWFRIVVNAGTANKDIAWMKQQAAEFTRHLPSGDAAVALSPASGGKLDRGN